MKFIWLMFIVACLSCSKNAQMIEKNMDEAWNFADSIQLTYNNTSNSPKKLILEADFTKEYKYQNIYVNFRIKSPDGSEQQSLVNFYLSDPTGKWQVSKSFSGKYEFSFPLNEHAVFPKNGNYVFAVSQYMRDEKLAGVSSVRFKVEE